MFNKNHMKHNVLFASIMLVSAVGSSVYAYKIGKRKGLSIGDKCFLEEDLTSRAGMVASEKSKITEDFATRPEKFEATEEPVFTMEEFEVSEDHTPVSEEFGEKDSEPEEHEEDAIPSYGESVDQGLYDYLTIEDLELSIRSYNCMKRAEIATVGELRTMTIGEFRRVRNLGKKSMEEIINTIKDLDNRTLPAPPVPVDYQAQLEELIGLESVKEQVKRITALSKMKKSMQESGQLVRPISLHMAFLGNPGTAKTTVARILAGLLHDIGILECSEIVEVGRADLIGEYTGQTAPKVENVFQEAKGKLLFIDEAYSLLDDYHHSYGDEAIDALVQQMENHRDETIVVMAGYPAEMEELLNRNPGLKSRVPNQIVFENYSTEELEKIVNLEADKWGFTIHEDAKEQIHALCQEVQDDVRSGNGRFCRNLVESAIIDYACRNYSGKEVAGTLDCVLRKSDFTLHADKKPQVVTPTFGFRV